MKRIGAAIVVMAFLLLPSILMADILVPDQNGNYRYYGNDGQTAVVQDNQQNGYNIYQNNGEVDRVQDNGNGYNTYQYNQPSPQPSYQYRSVYNQKQQDDDN